MRGPEIKPATHLPVVPSFIEAIYCDVDNVLAPSVWRYEFIDRGAKDLVAKWDGFHRASVCDQPNMELVEWLRAREDNVQIHFLTAMPDRYRKLRHWWLESICGFTNPSLLMREDEESEPAKLAKERVLRRQLGIEDEGGYAEEPFRNVLVIDDRADILLHLALMLGVHTAFYAIGEVEKL